MTLVDEDRPPRACHVYVRRATSRSICHNSQIPFKKRNPPRIVEFGDGTFPFHALPFPRRAFLFSQPPCPRLRLLPLRALCFVTTVSVACSWRLKGATHTLSPCLLLRFGGVAHVGSRPRSRLDPRGAHEMVISFRRTSSPRLSRPSRRARNSRRLCAREFSLSPTTRPWRLSGCPTRRSRRSTAWSSRRKQ